MKTALATFAGMIIGYALGRRVASATPVECADENGTAGNAGHVVIRIRGDHS